MGRYRKIYVLAPYNHATGGVELSHQLVDYLRNTGEDAYIVYVKTNLEVVKDSNSVTPAYSKYNIAISSEIEDIEDNILILPEVFFEYVLKYDRIRIGCWWMSVDNRYNNVSFPEYWQHLKTWNRKVRVLLSHFLLGRYSEIKNSTKDLIKNDDRIIHFYQSHYAFMHILSLGLTNTLPLSDYINLETVKSSETPKEDIILYNPAKGFAFTEKIINAMKEYRFVALQNLSREGLSELMSKAKLYIDFGEFPGKDRLPREAVMNGCCIITGKNGASKYYEDVPISEDYKFETISKNISGIVDKIKYVLENYDGCKPDFDFYRNQVKIEKTTFYKQIENAFK